MCVCHLLYIREFLEKMRAGCLCKVKGPLLNDMERELFVGNCFYQALRSDAALSHLCASPLNLECDCENYIQVCILYPEVLITLIFFPTIVANFVYANKEL
jgi:hypothetical protein